MMSTAEGRETGEEAKTAILAHLSPTAVSTAELDSFLSFGPDGGPPLAGMGAPHRGTSMDLGDGDLAALAGLDLGLDLPPGGDDMLYLLASDNFGDEMMAQSASPPQPSATLPLSVPLPSPLQPSMLPPPLPSGLPPPLPSAMVPLDAFCNDNGFGVSETMAASSFPLAEPVRTEAIPMAASSGVGAAGGGSETPLPPAQPTQLMWPPSPALGSLGGVLPATLPATLEDRSPLPWMAREDPAAAAAARQLTPQPRSRRQPPLPQTHERIVYVGGGSGAGGAATNGVDSLLGGSGLPPASATAAAAAAAAAGVIASPAAIRAGDSPLPPDGSFGHLRSRSSDHAERAAANGIAGGGGGGGGGLAPPSPGASSAASASPSPRQKLGGRGTARERVPTPGTAAAAAAGQNLFAAAPGRAGLPAGYPFAGVPGFMAQGDYAAMMGSGVPAAAPRAFGGSSGVSAGSSSGGGGGGGGGGGVGVDNGSESGLPPAPPSSEVDERRQKRLARNRESARQSRRRKKQYLEVLEEKVAWLTEEIENLRRLHLDSANATLRQLRLQHLQALEARLEQFEREIGSLSPVPAEPAAGVDAGAAAAAAAAAAAPTFAPRLANGSLHAARTAAEQSLGEGLQELMERFGPDCAERRSVVRHQFERLEGLVLPGYSRFLLWLVNQPESFFNGGDPADNGRDPAADDASAGMWAILSRELGLTQEQREKLRQCQKAAASDERGAAERAAIVRLLSLIHDLQGGMETYMEVVQKRMLELLALLTPSQAVRYLTWVQRNRDLLLRCTAEVAVAAATRGSTPGSVGGDGGGGDDDSTAATAGSVGDDGSAQAGLDASAAGMEPEEARVLRLLRAPDETLSIDDVTWLVEWVQRNRRRRGVAPLAAATARPLPSNDVLMELPGDGGLHASGEFGALPLGGGSSPSTRV